MVINNKSSLSGAFIIVKGYGIYFKSFFPKSIITGVAIQIDE